MTPMVTLRRTSAEDTEQVALWRAEPAARAFQPLEQIPVPRLRSILTERGNAQIEPTADSKFQWIVETAEGDAGWVSVTVLHRDAGLGAIGYTITTPLQGRGYATAAVRAILPTVFSTDALNLFRLDAVAAVDNIASRRVLEGNGFQCDGIAPRLLWVYGISVDHARYSLTRPDWLRQEALSRSSEADKEGGFSLR